MMIMKWILGAAAGGLLGFGYYKLVGCPGGGCPLTRHPWITVLYGALIGLLIAGSSK